MTQHGTQKDCRGFPLRLQPRQQGDPQSHQAAIWKGDSSSGTNTTKGTFIWEPKAHHSKGSVGQRKKDIRDSLDWDIQNEMPMVKRRSKEYEEHVPGRSAGLGAGRM